MPVLNFAVADYAVIAAIVTVCGLLVRWLGDRFIPSAGERRQHQATLKQSEAVLTAAREQCQAMLSSAQQQSIRTEELRLRYAAVNHHRETWQRDADKLWSWITGMHNDEGVTPLQLTNLALSLVTSRYLVAHLGEDSDVTKISDLFYATIQKQYEEIEDSDRVAPSFAFQFDEALLPLAHFRLAIDWAAEKRLSEQLSGNVPPAPVGIHTFLEAWKAEEAADKAKGP